MNAFRFNFDDDNEGFELIEETEASLLDDDEEENSQVGESEDDVIWETEEN